MTGTAVRPVPEKRLLFPEDRERNPTASTSIDSQYEVYDLCSFSDQEEGAVNNTSFWGNQQSPLKDPFLDVDEHPHYTDMLSPPSSSDGDPDWENLFPELENVDIEQETGKLYNFVGDEAYDSALIDRKPDPQKVLQTIHTYSAPPTRLGRPPKYAELEPSEGFAVSGHMSKNAVLARENRRKKKEYVTSLEQQIQDLSGDKQTLKRKLADAESQVDELQQEVEYLRSVIANETTIGSLLKNIPSAASISMKTRSKISTGGSKRSRIDHDYLSVQRQDVSTPTPGVCLHVAEKVVSIEFCKKCNDNSLTAET